MESTNEFHADIPGEDNAGLIMEVKCGCIRLTGTGVGDHLPENTIFWQDNNPFQLL